VYLGENTRRGADHRGEIKLLFELSLVIFWTGVLEGFPSFCFCEAWTDKNLLISLAGCQNELDSCAGSKRKGAQRTRNRRTVYENGGKKKAVEKTPKRI